MILELGDGRELQLPDDMADETARQLKRLILTCEERASVAERHAVALQDEVTHLRAEIQALAARPMPEMPKFDNREVVQALWRVEKALRADRVLLTDELDRPISRVKTV